MSTMFLRLTLVGALNTPILVNVDQIVRIHPSHPAGSTIVTTETDVGAVHVTASIDDLLAAMERSNGRVISRMVV